MLWCNLVYLSTAVWKLLDGLLLCVCSIETSQHQQREFRGFHLLTEMLALFYICDKIENLQYRKSRNVHGDKFGTRLLPRICPLILGTVIKLLGFCYLDVK